MKNLTGGKMIKFKILNVIYSIIRPLFVKNWDRNEDFYCCTCYKPLLRRYLYCSDECADKGDLY